ncbi:MAG TPA: sialidase family protein [Acidimicrobiales bacterium]|nr:sialidase family protein [Acidimicrobiales bacterium]
MRRAIGLVLGVSTLLVLPMTGTQAAEPPGVKAAVQVTGDVDPLRAHSSPQIAANPTNGELVIVEANVRGDRACTTRISVDDGRSWFPGGEIMQEPYLDCTLGAEYGPYATLGFSEDGTLYVGFVGSEFLDRARDDTPRHVFVARSDDGGRTFDTAMAFEAPDGDRDIGFNKGPVVAAHPTDSSKVYVGWRQGVFRNAEEKQKSNVAASSDGGRTFGPPVDLSDERGGDYPGLSVGGDGTVHAVYWARVFPPVPFGDPDSPTSPIYYRRSVDGGASFGEPVEIDPGNADAARPPVVAADPTSEALYVVWNSHTEQRNVGEDFQGDFEIFFLASTDGGASWGERLVLNDDDANVDQYLPGLSIAPDGRVDVAWYDDRLNPAEPEDGLQDVYATSSDNQGRTFSPNVRITDRSMDRTIGVWGNNIDSHHNVGVAATGNATYFAWQDSRNGDPVAQAEDIYMTKLARDASAGAGDGGGSRLLWAGTGAAGALLVAGIALVVASKLNRRSKRMQPA